MYTDSINDVYAWCLSLLEKSERLLVLADNGNYDSLVKINAPEPFIRERIQTDFKSNRLQIFGFHCVEINYDQGMKSNQQALNSLSLKISLYYFFKKL